jgi:hypothetical protein
MLTWTLKHPNATMDMLGYLPGFLSDEDPRSAKEQIHTSYQHGGGWTSFPGFELLENGNLQYPGDPETRLVAETKLRKEVVRLYEHAWVVILQEDGTWELARID